MKPWTLNDLERIAPRPGRRKSDSDDDHADRIEAHAGYLKALVDGWPELEKAEMTTPLRLAHFIAQTAHETGGFTIVREDTRWSAKRMAEIWPHRFSTSDPIFLAKHAACRGAPDSLAEMVYGYKIRPDLGNCEPDDGWHYRGGGMFQGTGRSWYREAGQAIGLDLENEPEQIEDPRVSLATAIWWWRKHKLNGFADQNFGRAVGNAINRGNPHSSKEPIGYADRQRWFDRAWAVLGNGALPAPKVDLGASGPDVEAAQRRLHDLGYPCGACDGQFGNETGRALAAFKRDWTAATGLPLEPGDTIGPATKAALANAEPISRSEREALTVADLKAAGSTEIANGLTLKKLGLGMLLSGATGGATSDPVSAPQRLTAPTPAVNPADALQSSVGWMPAFRQTAEATIDVVGWGVKHFWWVGAIVIGLFIYNGGLKVVAARLKAARSGINLSR